MSDDDLGRQVGLVMHRLYPPPDATELHLTSPASREPSRRGWWPAALAAAVVAALSVSIALIAAGGNNTPATDGHGTHGGLVGYSWTVTSLSDQYGTLTLASGKTTVAFTPDGFVVANDGCNGLSARYTLATHGQTIYGYSIGHDVNSTLVGCRFRPRSVRGRIMNEIDALFGLQAPNPHVGTTPAVSVHLDGDVLTLQSNPGHYLVTATRGHPQAPLTAGQSPTTPIQSTTPR